MAWRPRSFAAQLVVGVLYQLAIFGGILFGVAGTLRWARAWWLMVVVLVAAVASIAGLRHDPGLLEERYKGPIQPGQPAIDRVLTLLIVAEFLAFLVLIPLDVFRLHLLPPVPDAVAWLGLALFAAGWGIMALALRANSFAAPVVRRQEERGQVVVDRGPYAIVRHPMYAGDVPMMIGLALALGSYALALAVVVVIATLVARIGVEERLLRRTLPGYEDYTRRVRWRLVPGVW
jgi:protein-S-isoprenylcysteine O-methyltransferase Ste14